VAVDDVSLSLDLAVPCGLLLTELISNAAKYAYPDKKGGSVDIRFRDLSNGLFELSVADLPPGDYVRLAVSDTGMGMTDEELKGLFQQFHQVDGSSTRRAGGTGLGLVITRHLVTMHGGIVEVESEKGVGTTFWFTVPVYKRSTQTLNRIATSTN
jgi:signal transduction histidine kinase